jgi:hypothetical protein
MASEVVPMMQFTAIPNGPDWLLGMINLHGNLVPVCDLKRILGVGDVQGSGKPMILVLDKGENTAGFVIDGYPCAVAGLRPSNPVPGLPGLLARKVWLEFDNVGFLNEENQQ